MAGLAGWREQEGAVRLFCGGGGLVSPPLGASSLRPAPRATGRRSSSDTRPLGWVMLNNRAAAVVTRADERQAPPVLVQPRFFRAQELYPVKESYHAAAGRTDLV